MTAHRPRLMALHCFAGGIGYVVFQGQAIYDWGTIVARADKNAMSLRKLARLLDRFSPETLVLEEVETVARRAERIIALYKAIGELCLLRNIDLHLYQQADVHRTFGSATARTRQGVAEAVARQLQVLAPRLPSRRKPWQSEPRRMAIFSAAAVAVTHLAAEKRF